MRMRILAALVTTIAVATAQTDWPQYQGNPQHTGYLPVTLNPATLVPRYTVQVAPSAWLEPVTVADGKVFVSSTDRYLRTLTASTGAPLWQIQFPGVFSVNPPSYHQGKVYLQTGNHGSDTYLRCYHANTGQLVFQSAHAAQWESYYAPTIRDGAVWVNGGYYGGMYSFDAANGQQRWFVPLPQYDEWTPAVDGDTAYGYVGGTLFALNRDTGAERYRILDPGFSWQGWSMGLAPVLGGQNDVLVIQSARMLRFDLQSRTIAWQLPGSFTGQPAVHANTVFAINSNSLQARAQDTGALLWSWARPGETLSGNVVVTAQHVLVRSATKTFLIDRTTHAAVYEIAAAGHITIGEGAIYIARTDGHLTCVGFATLPTALAVTPAQRDYTAPPALVTIHGTGFAAGTGLTVHFGALPATQVTVVDDQTVTCVPPAHGPGVVAVVVENSNGRTSRPRAFAFTPAIDHAGDAFPGSTPTIAFHQPTGRQVLAGWGLGPRTALAFPPLVGVLEIHPAWNLFWTPHWSTNRFDLPLPIPANPALTGTTLLFQSLVGSSLFSSAQGTFANCYALTIQ
ncbi:MAG: hypothetical protein FJ265_01240 [Planctomycetes bacterium]|nr:hypothetical protein [Planctomycetota bacterium]